MYSARSELETRSEVAISEKICRKICVGLVRLKVGNGLRSNNQIGQRLTYLSKKNSFNENLNKDKYLPSTKFVTAAGTKCIG